jgi:Ca2+-binding RTX toxin-like protein
MATPTKWGHEFLVNTTKKGEQDEPTITGLADGRFVVAWTDWSGDKSGPAVRAQVFNADGSKAGGEFRINKTTDDSQGQPTIAALADGHFVVAWDDWSKTDGDKSKSAVRAQIFDNDGHKSGAEFLVNTTTKKAQVGPTITALADGGFIAAWSDASETTGYEFTFDVRAQIFDSDGSKSGGELLVNTTTESSQGGPTITGLADGRFVVAWTDWSETDPMAGATSGVHPRAQIFNADGSKSGEEIVVSPPTADNQWEPTITGLADGHFVVAWTYEVVDPFNQPRTVLGQVFNADGSKSGTNFLVKASTASMPEVVALADGRFVIAWADQGEIEAGKTSWGVRAQVFNPDGTASSGEFRVNATTKDNQNDLTITALADGRFVVAWADWSETDGDKSGGAVRGQVFDPRESAIDLVGSDLDDQFVGTRFGDIIKGVNRKDWLLGENGNDRLEGGKGRDVLEGGNGNDLLAGGVGKDKLKGGGGADQFLFREIGKENADKIIEFRPGKDLIVLDGDVFTGIGDNLGKEQFEIGVIYDKDKGKLLWDGDGKGGAKEMLFAKVDPGLKLGDDDFLMI